MPGWWSNLLSIVDEARALSFLRAAVIFLVGLFLARLVSGALARVIAKRTSAQQVMLARRITYWTILGLAMVSALKHLGFDLSVLLGAAGILTVAVGFASQTSASNLISGLFLIAERPFVVGDVIIFSGRTGEVVSMDLLSVKLRTFDNLLVRLPNEMLLKSEIVNVTYYPIRRLDLKIGVTFEEDIAKVRDILLQVADKNHLCLEEPKPVFLFLGYGEFAQNIQFSVWAAKENYVEVMNRMYEDVKEAFDAAGIALPFPTRTLAGDPNAPPIAITVVGPTGLTPTDKGSH